MDRQHIFLITLVIQSIIHVGGALIHVILINQQNEKNLTAYSN